MTQARKLYVKSFGCQMNVYDSRRMADTLAPRGYVETGAAEDADLVILNTCHIREKAAEKVYSELGRMRRLKEAAAVENRRVLIAVAGCVAQAEGEEIIRRAPAVDLVFGPQSYHRLPSLLARAADGRRAIDTEFSTDDKFAALAAPTRRGSARQTAARIKSVLLQRISFGSDEYLKPTHSFLGTVSFSWLRSKFFGGARESASSQSTREGR